MTATTNPAQPPSSQPPELVFEQIAFLVNKGNPDAFYQRAAVLDNAASRLQQISDQLRQVRRSLLEQWAGASADGVDERLRRVGGNVTEQLHVMRQPGYGNLMRKAGDALADAQQRMRVLQRARAEQAATSTGGADTASKEQQHIQFARRILTDLRTDYHDIAAAIAPLPGDNRNLTSNGNVVLTSGAYGVGAVLMSGVDPTDHLLAAVSGGGAEAAGNTSPTGGLTHPMIAYRTQEGVLHGAPEGSWLTSDRQAELRQQVALGRSARSTPVVGGTSRGMAPTTTTLAAYKPVSVPAVVGQPASASSAGFRRVLDSSELVNVDTTGGGGWATYSAYLPAGSGSLGRPGTQGLRTRSKAVPPPNDDVPEHQPERLSTDAEPGPPQQGTSGTAPQQANVDTTVTSAATNGPESAAHTRSVEPSAPGGSDSTAVVSRSTTPPPASNVAGSVESATNTPQLPVRPVSGEVASVTGTAPPQPGAPGPESVPPQASPGSGYSMGRGMAPMMMGSAAMRQAGQRSRTGEIDFEPEVWGMERGVPATVGKPEPLHDDGLSPQVGSDTYLGDLAHLLRERDENE